MRTFQNQHKAFLTWQRQTVSCTTEGWFASLPLLSPLFQEGVEVRVARIFNTFGPRMHMNDGRVVSNFILQALQGEPLTVGALCCH